MVPLAMRLFAQSDWVVWDTSVLTKFYDHIKTMIGPAVWIGILLLAAIIAIKVVVKIVNYYVNRG